MRKQLAVETSPQKMRQFDKLKNQEIDPVKLTVGSHKEVWWKCEYGHEWKSSVRLRFKTSYICPYCEGKRAYSKHNLKVIEPVIAQTWHSEKNGALLPSDVLPQSNKTVWWRCHKGHEWKAAISSRTYYQLGCPYCSGRWATTENNLLNTHPHLYQEWHTKKNENLSLADLKHGSNKKVWWQCKKGHEWQATPNKRTRTIGGSTNCPYCAAKKVTIENSFGNNYPHLIHFWNEKKNEGLTPFDVTKMSGKKVWWQCKKGHEWQGVIHSVAGGKGCPTCSKHYKSSFPEYVLLHYLQQIVPTVYHQYDIYGIKLDIFIPSLSIGVEYDGLYYHKSIERDQKKEHHCYSYIPNFSLIRVREKGCPEYKKINKKTTTFHRVNNYAISSLELVVNQVLSHIFADKKTPLISIKNDFAKIQNLREHIKVQNSLAVKYPDLVKEWAHDKNGSLSPYDISAYSQMHVWWICQKGHLWWAIVSNRTKHKNGCPYCGGKRTTKINNISKTHPHLQSEWHPTKNTGKMTDYKAGSNKKAWWRCKKGHEWNAVIASRANRSKPTGCPYCAKHYSVYKIK